jgi:hypothetical protein
MNLSENNGVVLPFESPEIKLETATAIGPSCQRIRPENKGSWQAGGARGIRTRGTVIRLCARRLAAAFANVIARGDSVAILHGQSGLRASPLKPKNSTIKNRGQLLSFLFAVAPNRTMSL